MFVKPLKIFLGLTILSLFISLFVACSETRPKTNEVKDKISWVDRVNSAQENEIRSDNYYGAFLRTGNLLQIKYAIEQIEISAKKLYDVQQDYLRASDFAYQTLLRRKKVCEKYKTYILQANKNRLYPPEMDARYCTLTFQ